LAGAFLPDGIVVAVGSYLEPCRDEVPDVVPSPDLDDHLAVDLCHVGIAVVLEDGELARRRDSVALAHRHQRCDLVLETPVEEMVVEDARIAGVREDVGVALHDLVGGEGPHGLRRAGVVVVDERDGLGRPPR